MDLYEEFERHAAAASGGAGARLQGTAVRARLDARVSRARRIENAKVGVGVVASVGVVAAGAMFAPRLWQSAAPAGAPTGVASVSASATATDAPAPSESVGPSPTVSPTPVDPAAMPSLGGEGYLAAGVTVWDVAGPLTCDALAASAPEDGVGFDVSGQRVPLPAWLETGRLYGWGDDVLVGGTPAPLGAMGQADYEALQVLASDFSAGPGDLVLTGAGGERWGFTVMWEERDDLPHDAPGVFAVISPDFECNSGVIPEGVYEARMAFRAGDQTTQVVQLELMTVVGGVPSLPEVDAAGR